MYCAGSGDRVASLVEEFPKPQGTFRDVLDFLAMERWHPCVWAALGGLVVLSLFWYLRPGHFWFFTLVRILRRRALSSGDVQAQMDGMAVSIEVALMGGTPLLFGLHMLSRRRPKNILLTRALIRLLFVGSAIWRCGDRDADALSVTPFLAGDFQASKWVRFSLLFAK